MTGQGKCQYTVSHAHQTFDEFPRRANRGRQQHLLISRIVDEVPPSHVPTQGESDTAQPQTL